MGIAFLFKVLLVAWYTVILVLLQSISFCMSIFVTMVRVPLSLSRYVVESIIWPVAVLAVIGGSIGLATGGLVGIAAIWLDVLPIRQDQKSQTKALQNGPHRTTHAHPRYLQSMDETMIDDQPINHHSKSQTFRTHVPTILEETES